MKANTRSPARVARTALIVLTGINLLNYIDRYIFSALLPAIKADLGFSDTELGLLGSGFILAYLFISPIFGYFGDRSGRSKIMAAGVAFWSVATAFSGICRTFVGQMTTRVVVGVGESAYSVIAPSTIADYFPKHLRGRTFAIYSGAIPVGSALGYALGGWLEPIFGWRKAFFLVGVPGVLLALILFFLPDPPRGLAEENKFTEKVNIKAAPPSIFSVYKSLFLNGGFLFTVLGYAAYTFVVGGMAYWMPSYIVRYYDVSLSKGTTVFGALTVVGGFIGTFLGGWWADRIERKSGNGFLKVSVLSMIFAFPLFLLTLQMRSFTSFSATLLIMEIALFLCMSPLDAAVIGYVKPSLRATAMALNVFLIHFLGDGISRYLIGSVSDASGLRAAFELLPVVLLVALVLWQLGVILFWQPITWPKQALTLPKYQAHRGFRPAGVRENTLNAFRLAREHGATMCECDIHLTADAQAVVFHDEDLSRIGGRSDKVCDLTAEQMQTFVDAPTLFALLTDPLVPSRINIELKTSEVRGEGHLEAAAVEAVIKAGAEGRVLFSSFNPFSLRRLSKLAPEIPRALLVSEIDEPRNAIYLKKMWLAWLARPHLVHLHSEMVTPRRAQGWADRGLPIAVWTVNDPKEAERVFSLGVVSVITDTLFQNDHVAPVS